MKIFMIASLYRPYSRGGAEVVFQALVDELKKSHDVVVVSLCPWAGVRSLIPCVSREDGVRVWRFFPLNIFSFITILKRPFFLRFFWHIIDAFNIHSYFIIRSLLKKERPDIVLTHNLKGIGLTIPVAIAQSRIQHIHTAHDIHLVEPSGILIVGTERFLANRIMSFISSLATRWLFGSPAAVVFPSCFLLDFYIRRNFFPRSKRIVLKNPHENTKIEMRREQRAASAMTFAYVGQLEHHKGVAFLLRAWSAWKQNDALLLIAGRGTLESVVRGAARRDSRIVFSGYCDDVVQFLNSVSFVVVPSLCYENAPMIILESGACGVPAIGARIGGIPEYINDNVNGFLFSPGNEQSLIDALEQAIASRGKYDELSQQAKNSVRTYTIQHYCEQLLRVI